MKNITLILAIAVLVYACSDGSTQEQQADNMSKNAVLEFIPGTYVRAFSQDISENTKSSGNDTLRITKQTDAGSETFLIKRSTLIRRMLDGKKEPDQSRSADWTGSFREGDKTLFVNNTGLVIAFDIDKRILLMDNNEYNKIE